MAAAAFANAAGDESEPDQAGRNRVTDDLTKVYSRVPVDVSHDESRILDGVQHKMAGITKTFWRRHRDEPGTAGAVAMSRRSC